MNVFRYHVRIQKTSVFAPGCFELRLPITPGVQIYPPLAGSASARKCGARGPMGQHQDHNVKQPCVQLIGFTDQRGNKTILLCSLCFSGAPDQQQVIISYSQKQKSMFDIFSHPRSARPSCSNSFHHWLSQTSFAQFPHLEDSQFCSERGKCL